MIQKLTLASLLLLTASCIQIGDFGKVTYADMKSSEPSQGETRLQAEVDMSVGELMIQPGENDFTYKLDARYNKEAYEPKVSMSRDGDTAKLKVTLEKTSSGTARGKNELDLRLNPQAVLALTTKAGVGEARIDLSDMKVEELRLASGVGATRLTMLTANPVRCKSFKIEAGVGALEATGLGNLNFESMRFEGGVGGAELDFSGAWENPGEIEIEVGVGGVEIRIPRDVGVRLRASESFLSGLDLNDFQKEGGGRYRSNNIDDARKVISIRLETGIGGVEINWI
ncbi:MAG TPA: LiaF domain-containing protein [Acidobacteriota bacterium]|nr:LiaF domain-containing protein [Acidobacteriota bacterium]